MVAIQYLVPGGAYVNEGTSQLEYLIPGGTYVDETNAVQVGGGSTLIHMIYYARKTRKSR